MTDSDPVLLSTLHGFFAGFFSLFGSLLGSFTNVVILRMGQGRSVVFPPSACPACSHQLHAKDLVPVLSWLTLRGRCRYCSASISWQYPLVEALCALTVGIAFYRYGFTPAFPANAAWGVILIVVAALWVRGEVRVAAPYLFANPYLVLLSRWGGRWPDLRLAAGILLMTGIGFLLLRWRHADLPHAAFTWGLAAGLWSLAFYGTVGWILAVGVLIVQVLVPWRPATGFQPARLVLFLYLLIAWIAGVSNGFVAGV